MGCTKYVHLDTGSRLCGCFTRQYGWGWENSATF